MIRTTTPGATPKTIYAFALPGTPDALAIFSALYRFPYTQFLDSTAPGTQAGRYSVIAFQPVEILESWGERVSVTNRDQQLSLRGDMTALLTKRLEVWGQGNVMPDPTLPPFQGGAVGYFGFGHAQGKQGITDIPQAAFGIYDQCVSFDHAEGRAWYVVVTDKPEIAQTKYAYFQRLTANNYLPRVDSVQPHLSWAPLTLPAALKENVRRLNDYIRAGSFDHAYLCQFYESTVPAGYDAAAHYQTLRAQHKTPQGACMMLGGLNIMICDADPVFTVNDRQIEMHHISHQRPRPEGSLRDDVAERTLLKDESALNAHRKMAKEQTIRLSSLCRASGILGPSNPEVVASANQYHLTSVTRGVLADNMALPDLLAAFTPSPAHIGQPIERALRVIGDMEPVTRGPVCGHTATISFNGNITLTLNHEAVLNNGSSLRFAVGAAVTANTEPDIWLDDLVQKAEAALERISNDTGARTARVA